MKRSLFAGLIFVSLVFSSACSMVKYKSGDDSRAFLEGADKVLVKLDFSATRVGKFATEAEYIEKRMTEVEEKEPGKGEEWKKKWEDQKESVFAHQLTKLINEYTVGKKGIEFGTNFADAPVVMVVGVTFLEPGWNVGISRRNAEINIVVEMFKASDMNTPLVTYELNRVPGGGAMGFDFDAGYRMGQAFAKAGKELGKYFSK
ncbi:MAG TPA: hypothetical protein ENN58_01825 [bacterium]|nr:hypothetical protein [bacterium]